MAQKDSGTQLQFEKQLGEHTCLVKDVTGPQRRLSVLRQLKFGDMTDDRKTELIEELKLHQELVNHRYCMRICDVICEREMVNVTTEYCEGGTLKALLARASGFGEVLNEIEVMDWVTQLFLALQHLHQQGIPHLNLSTRNIYLKNNCVKLTESRQLRNLYRRTAVDGHLAAATDDEKDNNACYRSPEEISSGEFSTKSDIWSVGCILYEMCAQEPLFRGRTAQELNRNICEQSLPKFPDVFSTDLRHVWERLLDRDVSRRPSAKDALNLPFVSAHLQDMEDSLDDPRRLVSDHATDSLQLSTSQRVDDAILVRGVDDLTVSNNGNEDEADSEDPEEVGADGYVDLGLTEEETRRLFNLS